jgi:hypothetical protein
MHAFKIAGDSGIGLAYAKSRETGNENATAAMAGVANSYTQFIGTFAGQPVLVRTLIGAPQVSPPFVCSTVVQF